MCLDADAGALIKRTTIRELVGYRDAALAKAAEGARLIAQGHALADEAAELARRAHGAAVFTGHDYAGHQAFGRLFNAFDADASTEAFRRAADARVWMHLMTLTGMDQMMDRTAREELERDLCGDVPAVTEDAALATFERLASDARLIFRRGLARAFIELDRRFKSHDGFKIGARVVLTNVFDGDGYWNYGVPQHRRRLFIVATRSTVPLHLELPKRPHVGAASIIDFEAGRWSPVRKPGRSAKTLARIEAGRRAHGSRFLTAYYGSARGGRSLDRPIGTLTTRARWAVVDGERMRMVSVAEAKAAMGFRPDYVLPPSQKLGHLLGNAVVTDVAQALVEAIARAA